MKAKELRNLGEKELLQKAMELKKELFNLRFQLKTGQLLNTAIIKKKKKDLARIYTVIKERELSKAKR